MHLLYDIWAVIKEKKNKGKKAEANFLKTKSIPSVPGVNDTVEDRTAHRFSENSDF